MAYGVQAAFQQGAFQLNAFQIDGSFGGIGGADSARVSRFVSREDYDRWRRKRIQKAVKAITNAEKLKPASKVRVDKIIEAYKSPDDVAGSVRGINISALVENEILFAQLIKPFETKAEREWGQKIKLLVELNNKAIITMLLMEGDE